MAKQKATPGRGFGSVFRATYKDAQGNRKEAATWTVRYFARGKQWFKSAHTTDKRVAEELLRKLTASKAPPPQSDKVTWQQLADLLVNDYQINKRRSADRLAGSLNHLRLAFLGSKVREVTAARIMSYIGARQEEGAANATINRELAALKRMFSLGQKKQLIRSDDIPNIEMLTEASPRKGFFERSAFESVRRHLPPELQPLLTCAYITGWRLKSELLTRTWAHVDFTHNWLRLEPGETKNDEGRQFPLIAELREALLQQRAYTDQIQKENQSIVPNVFHRQGRPIHHLRRAWRSACKKAGCPDRIPHDMRRTAVRNLERSGVSRSAAMKMVGHKTESIYRRYAIVSEGDLQRAGEQLAALGQQKQNPGETTKRVVRELAPRSIERGRLT